MGFAAKKLSNGQALNLRVMQRNNLNSIGESLVVHHRESGNLAAFKSMSNANPGGENDHSMHAEMNIYVDENDNESTNMDETSLSTTESYFDSKEFMIEVLSNLMFLVGSSFYLTTSAMDWKWAMFLENVDDDYYDYDDDAVYFELDSYTYISIFGAVLMILNALLDLSQCIRRANTSGIISILHRDILSNFLAACTFGFAGTMDLWLCFLSGNVLNTMNRSYIASANLYLLSAVLSLCGKPMCRCSKADGVLNLIGDWLFLKGSLIDVGVSFVSDPEIMNINSQMLSGLGLFSSFLWLVDAGKS